MATDFEDSAPMVALQQAMARLEDRIEDSRRGVESRRLDFNKASATAQQAQNALEAAQREQAGLYEEREETQSAMIVLRKANARPTIASQED